MASIHDDLEGLRASSLPKMEEAVAELMAAASDVERPPTITGWPQAHTAKIELGGNEHGAPLTFEVAFSVNADKTAWVASVAGCTPASPKAVGWWLARVWSISTPGERDWEQA